ncbi:hypothetical protein [Aidingimonas lacisalsi]|uniref:hypothetical protein n=1 Tax=Aidingimonas lacisalsi TaxID=2604086 RepID=UPI001375623F|nr:hypothetical protein [Aidingimonas lacisalsi]
MASIPRYLIDHHTTRLGLMVVAFVGVGIVAIWHWRLLDSDSRQRMPKMVGRLGGWLAAGLTITALWQISTHGIIIWPLWLSQAALSGLLLHVVTLLWQRA